MKKIVKCLLVVVFSVILFSVKLSAVSTDVYNVVTCPGQDMSTEIQINCQSATNVKKLYVEYTTSDDTGYLKAKTVEGTYSEFSRENTKYAIYVGFSSVRHVWNFKISDLTPSTDYIYRIKNDTEVYASNYHFETASASDDEFSFLFMTDPQYYNESTSMHFNILANNAITNSDVKFAFVTGDISDKGGNSSYWTHFYNKDSLTKIPYVTTVGNHEYYDSQTTTTDNSIYQNFFYNPQNGPENVKGSSYYMLYNNSLFIMLDSEDKANTEQQKEWFKDVCYNYDVNYIIVGCHRSMYAGAQYYQDGQTFKSIWQETFDECGVDLVLSGHDHMYSRTKSIYNDQVSTDPYLGTVYILGGAAGVKFYSKSNDENLPKWDNYFDNKTVATTITVGKDYLTTTTKDKDGNVLDSATINRKRFGTRVDNFVKADFESSFKIENAMPDLTSGTISWSKDGYGYVSSVTCYSKNSSAKIGSIMMVNDLMNKIEVKDKLWIGEINTIQVDIVYRDGTKSSIELKLDNTIEWGSVSNFRVSNVTYKTVELTVDQSLINNYIQKYRVYKDGRVIKTITLSDADRAKGTFTYTVDSGLEELTKYVFKIEALNVNGTSVWSAEVNTKTLTSDPEDIVYQKDMAQLAMEAAIKNLLATLGIEN